MKFTGFLEGVYFIKDNFNYFVERDKINYKPLNPSYYYYIYPTFEDIFYLNEIERTKREFAEYYIISIPLDMQVSTKDLQIGLTNDNRKVKTIN